MINQALRLSLAMICVLTATMVFAASDAEDLEKVRAKISEMFSEINPEDIGPGPIDGWFEIGKGAVVAYVSADGRYLIQGDIVDLDAQINLTETARNGARMEMMASISDEELIVFTPEDPKYSISVFTDIDCTYCRKLHAQIDEYLEYGIEVRYLLYPRNGPTSPSWAKAENVWCSDNRNEALTLAKLGQSFDHRDCDASVVHSHYSIGQDVGLSGTPAIVMEDGQLVSGYLPPLQLVDALAASAP